MKKGSGENGRDWLTRISRECLREIGGLGQLALDEGRDPTEDEARRAGGFLRRYDSCQQLLAIEFPEEDRK